MGMRYDLNHSRDLSSKRHYGGSTESLRCVVCGSHEYSVRIRLSGELKTAVGLRPTEQAYLCPQCAADGVDVTMDRLLGSGYWTLEPAPQGVIELLDEPEQGQRGRDYWVLGAIGVGIAGAVAWALGRD